MLPLLAGALTSLPARQALHSCACTDLLRVLSPALSLCQADAEREEGAGEEDEDEEEDEDYEGEELKDGEDEEEDEEDDDFLDDYLASKK